jgi:hypothetical protein
MQNVGPDFSANTAAPFFVLGNDNIQVLEIPLTILYTNNLVKKYLILKKPYSLFRKILGRIKLNSNNFLSIQPSWMRPFPGMTSNNLIEVWNAAERSGLDYVVMMLHSSELMPDASVYRPDQASVDSLFQALEGFFQFIKNKNLESITLSDASVEIIGSKKIFSKKIK